MTIQPTLKAEQVNIQRLTPDGTETVLVNYHESFYTWDKEQDRYIEEKKCILNADIIDALPHGSGIDGSWSVDVTRSSIRLHNFYHAMDTNGFYDGYADFTVIIPLFARCDHWADYFKLQFNGNEAYNLNRKYALRDYLEQTIYDSLHQIFSYEIVK